MEKPRGPTVASTIKKLESWKQKLLDMALANQIGGEDFAVENRRLSSQIKSLRDEMAEQARELSKRDQLAEKFDTVVELLANMDFGVMWEHATD